MKQHIAKLAEKYIGRPFFERNGWKMTEDELCSAIAWTDEYFRWIVSQDGEKLPTIDWILELAEQAVIRFGVKGLVIDPYNEIEHNRPSNQTETEYVSIILSKVKRFAKNHGVHVWFIAHPAKQQKDRDGSIPVPSLYDISGSANWINKADIGLVIHRTDPTDVQGKTQVWIKKMRFKELGKVGHVELRYDISSGRYQI